VTPAHTLAGFGQRRRRTVSHTGIALEPLMWRRRPVTNRIRPDFPETLRRINYLVDELRLKRYLEIGLGNGGTFDNVTAPHKVGVDPHPWNSSVKELDGVQLITSDEYFSRDWSSGIKFDLILLDGLHTAEQTYRDFVNSLHYSHVKTIWLIDDVIPNDQYSAIPDNAEAIRQRKAAGIADTAWHGDVYKVVWMIKSFHNNMVLRTFTGTQPQSLVYFSDGAGAGAGAGASPSNTTLNDIAGLSFADTVSRRSDYNLREEHDILAECVATLRRRVAR
jgi:hypothetical protein